LPATALAGAGVPAGLDLPAVGGHVVPPEAVEWSGATEKPEATEPLSAMESPELTELFVAWPKPEHTDVASAVQLPDSFGAVLRTGAAAGAGFVFAASAGAVSTMLAAVTRPVIATRQPTPATRILLIFIDLSLCSSLLVACLIRYPLRNYAVASSLRPKPENATSSAPRARAKAPAAARPRTIRRSF